jgi:hypothetical protein
VPSRRPFDEGQLGVEVLDSIDVGLPGAGKGGM